MAGAPRVPLIDPAQTVGSLKDYFEKFLQERGNIPNMLRAMGHRPEIAVTAFAHMDAVLGTGTVPRVLKELVTVRTSQLNHCAY